MDFPLVLCSLNRIFAGDVWQIVDALGNQSSMKCAALNTENLKLPVPPPTG
jgi:hypothetical protein